MNYCQGTKCHEYKTKDRIRGTKGSKSYQTRRRSTFYYSDNFCSMNCQSDWLKQNIEHALDHFGRVTEPKKVMCDAAWYKDYNWGRNGNHTHFLINDLLGQRIPITERQYQSIDNDNIVQVVAALNN